MGGEYADKDKQRIALTRAAHKRTAKAKEAQIARIGAWDVETDPFNRADPVFPFLIVAYFGDAPGAPDPWILWRKPGETLPEFYQRFLTMVEELPNKWILYSHNGGRFDMKFFQPLFRGDVAIKGASSIMKAKVGNHELRDSLHILPVKLSAYRKDGIDYTQFTKSKREAFKPTIIDYCLSDCRNTLDFIKGFWREFGNKISIGQTAYGLIRKKYPNIARLSEHQDGRIRGIDTNYYHRETYGRSTGQGFYMGGRVECFAGRGSYSGRYSLYDVNSMYPYVMAHVRHPIGSEFSHHTGPINDHTAFVRIRCRSEGGLLSHGQNGLTGDAEYGIFNTTIHEYKMNLQLGLIHDVEIIECIDCDLWTDFSDFILPLYASRQETKRRLDEWDGTKDGDEYLELKRKDLFYKLLMNSCYGKFAQNPRRFRNQVFMDLDDEVTFEYSHIEEYQGEMPYKIVHKLTDGVWNDQTKSYELRKGDARLRFNNVATGASITGAARAHLLFALFNAVDPIYCDTDSIICRSLGFAVRIDQTELGAWKLEKNTPNVLIAGKKLYALQDDKGETFIKAKGATGLTYSDIEAILRGETIASVNQGVTFNPDGSQYYLLRQISSTANVEPTLFREYHNKRS